jgi:hypothetical protein
LASLDSLKSSKTMSPSSISFWITNGSKFKGKIYNKTNRNREIPKTIIHERLLINHRSSLRITSHIRHTSVYLFASEKMSKVYLPIKLQ